MCQMHDWIKSIANTVWRGCEGIRRSCRPVDRRLLGKAESGHAVRPRYWVDSSWSGNSGSKLMYQVTRTRRVTREACSHCAPNHGNVNHGTRCSHSLVHFVELVHDGSVGYPARTTVDRVIDGRANTRQPTNAYKPFCARDSGEC